MPKRSPNKKKSHSKTIFFSILAVLICIVLGSWFLFHQTTPRSFSVDEQEKINETVTSFMDKYKIPGVIVAIWIPEKGNFIKGYGLANTDTKQTMDPFMSFRIGSITKTFIATILLQLQDEGKINLDDTLDMYITNPAVPNANKITLRQLSNMTSGLYNYSNDTNFEKNHAENLQKPWTSEELVNIAISHPSNFMPGTEYEYSNTNFILLGMVIEKVTGNTIEKEVKNRIISPLKLSNTYYPTTSYMPLNSAHGYSLVDLDTKEVIDTTYDNPSWGAAAGAIVSDIHDLRVWAEAMGKGKLISPVAQKQRFTWDTQPGAAYGIGTMKIGKNFVGHEGHIDGYNTVFFYLPSKNATIIVMQNLNPSETEGIAGNIGAMIAKIVLPHDVNW